MPIDELDYIARRPRHQAADTTRLRARVERPPGSEPGSIEVDLVDLSRKGAKFRTTCPLAIAEAITVRLCDDEAGVELSRPATVRWRHRDPGDTWSIGCEFSQQVDWETLGELFLNKVLSTEPPARCPPSQPPPNSSAPL